MQANKSGLNRLCECEICRNRLKDAQICPDCSNPFCHTCITEWLSNNRACPVCQKQLTVERLIKARLYEQDAIENGSVVECGAHKKQISLFCWPCLECLCVTCMFAETHAGHKDKIVLCESAAPDLKTLITDELKWIVNREQEIAHALGLHGENEKKLMDERDRILGNVQEVLTDVQGQFEEACAVQKEGVILLEADNKCNAELRQVSEEWIESEKIFEHLPNVADLLKHDRYNSSLTKPKSIKLVKPKFKNDLVPELAVFKLDIKDRANPWTCTCLADPGFVFKVQVSSEEESVYRVALGMTKGLAGQYLMALGNNPLALIKLKLHEAVILGCIKPEQASSSVTIRMQLAKTYGEKCRQYEALAESTVRKKQLLETENDLDLCFLVFLFFLGLSGLVVSFLIMSPWGERIVDPPPAKFFDWW